ncbi:MAG: hypothetical protein HQL37_07615 [Alphaproteobacteria bacterium]|nr:hypothetical protein [Alphaproteobacteria bacterium]
MTVSVLSWLMMSAEVWFGHALVSTFETGYYIRGRMFHLATKNAWDRSRIMLDSQLGAGWSGRETFAAGIPAFVFRSLMSRVPFFFAILMAMVLGAVNPAQGQAMDSPAMSALAKDRGRLLVDYRKAMQDEQKMASEQKIAMEQLKVDVARKQIGKPIQPPDQDSGLDPGQKKISDLVQKQRKQIAPLQQRRKDLGLQLRNNMLEQQKLKVADRYKKLSAPDSGSKSGN